MCECVKIPADARLLGESLQKACAGKGGFLCLEKDGKNQVKKADKVDYTCTHT